MAGWVLFLYLVACARAFAVGAWCCCDARSCGALRLLCSSGRGPCWRFPRAAVSARGGLVVLRANLSRLVDPLPESVQKHKVCVCVCVCVCVFVRPQRACAAGAEGAEAACPGLRLP